MKTNTFKNGLATTVGVESSKFEMLLNDVTHVKLQVWDTAG